MDAQLIDKIYESCFTPEVWPEVLEEMGRISGSPGASLFISRGEAVHCVTSPEPRARAEQIVKGGWLWRGTLIARLFAERHAGFLIDVEYYSPDELEREPIYREVWRRNGDGDSDPDRRKDVLCPVAPDGSGPLRTRLRRPA